MIDIEILFAIGRQMEDEAEEAAEKYPPFNSAHEGFAVLLEEVEELKAEVFKKQSKRDLAAMRKEAIQIGAMALRFVHDVCINPAPQTWGCDKEKSR